ncbi:motility associated factor glycosyltransferase family protein [Paenibacillus plantiphilus]|nr:6-hydroxymethylpterin diphosphokinase MptE-like protein [Paenibacillus plantiphilus]
MKSLKEDNLNLIREYYPHIYSFIKNQETDREQYQLLPTKSDLYNIEIKRKENPSFLLYSKYDPRNETENWINSVEEVIGESQSILLFGFGLGYHMERLIERYPDRTIYVIEPDLDIFLTAMEARDHSKILKHKKIGMLAIGKGELVFRRFIATLTSQLSNSFCLLYMPNYLKLYEEEIKQFQELFRATILTDRTNYATQIIFKREWPENAILNLLKTYKGRSLTGVKSYFKDHTAIIVGSGPSLDQDIDYLRELQNHAIIIAAGTSTQALLSRGIRPHLIVSVDGSVKNYEAFSDLDIEGIPFVYASYIKHKIIEEKVNELYHVFISSETMTSYIIGLTESDPSFFTTASVTGTVIQTAVYLGCKKLIFVGQDLSYPGKTIYSSGIDHFSDKELTRFINNISEEVQNVQGGTNPTTKPMKNMLENIEMVIGYYDDTIEFINTSQMGAVIKGARNVPLSKMLDELKCQEMTPEKFGGIFNDHALPYSDTKTREIIDRMHECLNELRRLQEGPITKILDEFESLSKKLDKKKEKTIEKSLVRINWLWEEITSSAIFDPVYGFVVQVDISIYYRFLPTIIDCSEITKKAEFVITHLGRLVASIYSETPILIKLFEQVIESVNQSKKNI